MIEKSGAVTRDKDEDRPQGPVLNMAQGFFHVGISAGTTLIYFESRHQISMKFPVRIIS